jgi:PAP2 superfamily
MVLTKQSRLRVEALDDRCLPSAAFVPEWNSLLLNVQQLHAQGNQQSARALAIMGAAVYDSVNAIDPTHTVYHVDARAFPGVSTASADAAAAQAAHDVAFGLYTQPADRALFDALLTTQLAEITDGQPETDGIALGHYVAGQMLAWRANDGSGLSVPYTIGHNPGDWQPTPPAYNPVPATPQWPGVTPFALESGSQFRPGPPPALTSADYAAAFNESKALGSITSSTRTPEQTEIAFFWAGLGVSNAGVAIWNQITQTVAAAHDLNLADNARLFAEVSVSAADAFIAGFDAKYAYNFWRPVTAIRAADTDGNPDTIQDSTWTPLIPTPNHPSYVALHATQSRAAAEALASFFGTDHVSFTATWAGVERSFNKFTDAAKEAGKSRIFGGIHWSFDVAAGEQLGRKVGQYAMDHYFQPLTDSGGRALGAAAAAPATVTKSLHGNQARPLLNEALARWRAAGIDTSALGKVDVRIADLGGLTLGKVADGIIWLDDNAAGWGWFVDRTPRNDSEFVKAGNQGEQNRMDLLTVLMHETGHLLGRDHEATGVMQETLTAGTRRNVNPVDLKDGGWLNVDLSGLVQQERKPEIGRN